MTRFTDLAYARQEDGIYDLVIDPETSDLKTTDGLESALFVSLFSDRRAYADEVSNPRSRRGWIGDLVADVPGDMHGSGLWLYEQHRLTPDVENGVRLEAEQALAWLVDDELITYVAAETLRLPSVRTLSIKITLTALDGGISTRAYELADATRRGALVSL